MPRRKQIKKDDGGRTASPTDRQTDIRQLARVLGFLAPYRRQVAIALVALVVAAGCVLVLGQGLRRVIDGGFSSGDAALLDSALAALLVVIVVMAIATYMRFYYVSWIGERVIADIRRAVFGHLLDLSPGFFETVRTGEVISRLTNDTTLLESVIGSTASFALRNTLIMLGGLVMLIVTSPKLTALVVLACRWCRADPALRPARAHAVAREPGPGRPTSGAQIDETLHEIRTVQAYGHEERDRAAFGTRVEAAFAAARARIRQRALLTAW